MQIDRDRDRLKKLLIEKTDMSERLARDIAAEKIRYARKLAGISSDDVSGEETQKYILDHSEEIGKKVGDVLDDLCVKILPRERVMDLLLQFGVLSLFLVPPIIFLIRRCVFDYAGQNMESVAAGIASCLLLVILLIASAVAVFKKERNIINK